MYILIPRVHNDGNLNDIQESNSLANLWFTGVCIIVLIRDILLRPVGRGTFPGVQMLRSLFRPDSQTMWF
jgi:hypothetical protein